MVVAARRMASTMSANPTTSPAMPKPRLGISSVTIHQPPTTAMVSPRSAKTSSTPWFSKNTRTATSSSRSAPRARIASTRCRVVTAGAVTVPGVIAMRARPIVDVLLPILFLRSPRGLIHMG